MCLGWLGVGLFSCCRRRFQRSEGKSINATLYLTFEKVTFWNEKYFPKRSQIDGKTVHFINCFLYVKCVLFNRKL